MADREDQNNTPQPELQLQEHTTEAQRSAPDISLGDISMNFMMGYEEGTNERNLAALRAKILPAKLKDFAALDDEIEQKTLAVIASLDDKELKLLKQNHKRIAKTAGLHDLVSHLYTLHKLTGDSRYLLD